MSIMPVLMSRMVLCSRMVTRLVAAQAMFEKIIDEWNSTPEKSPLHSLTSNHNFSVVQFMDGLYHLSQSTPLNGVFPPLGACDVNVCRSFRDTRLFHSVVRTPS